MRDCLISSLHQCISTPCCSIPGKHPGAHTALTTHLSQNLRTLCPSRCSPPEAQGSPLAPLSCPAAALLQPSSPWGHIASALESLQPSLPSAGISLVCLVLLWFIASFFATFSCCSVAVSFAVALAFSCHLGHVTGLFQ